LHLHILIVVFQGLLMHNRLLLGWVTIPGRNKSFPWVLSTHVIVLKAIE